MITFNLFRGTISSQLVAVKAMGMLNQSIFFKKFLKKSFMIIHPFKKKDNPQRYQDGIPDWILSHTCQCRIRSYRHYR